SGGAAGESRRTGVPTNRIAAFTGQGRALRSGSMNAAMREAMQLRATWMRAQGLSESEIREFCDPERFPADLETERANVAALRNLRDVELSREELQQIARGTPPTAD